jgi:poly(3-hydroxybutyrate) depolymerase
MRAFSGNVFDELVLEHGFVVVYPDGYKGHWNDARISSNFPTRKAGTDDVAFTHGMRNELYLRSRTGVRASCMALTCAERRKSSSSRQPEGKLS